MKNSSRTDDLFVSVDDHRNLLSGIQARIIDLKILLRQRVNLFIFVNDIGVLADRNESARIRTEHVAVDHKRAWFVRTRGFRLSGTATHFQPLRRCLC